MALSHFASIWAAHTTSSWGLPNPCETLHCRLPMWFFLTRMVKNQYQTRADQEQARRPPHRPQHVSYYTQDDSHYTNEIFSNTNGQKSKRLDTGLIRTGPIGHTLNHNSSQNSFIESEPFHTLCNSQYRNIYSKIQCVH